MYRAAALRYWPARNCALPCSLKASAADAGAPAAAVAAAPAAASPLLLPFILGAAAYRASGMGSAPRPVRAQTASDLKRCDFSDNRAIGALPV